MSKSYTASKSRSQEREGWSVIFRHPVLLDRSGKLGKRVRRGLGTKDAVEADRLVGELNELLRSSAFWDASARSTIASRFDRIVLDIFYDGIEPQRIDGAGVRDELIPLPGPDQDYRSVLMLGTTGAGKTTLVRQLLGTDPVTERFPSTSTAKTTVADTELIFDPSPQFRAAVTFVSRDEVIDYLTECVSEAALALFRDAGDREVRRRLLDHPNQRFRFSYVLGRSGEDRAIDADDIDDDDLDGDAFATEKEDELDSGAQEFINSRATEEVISSSITSLRKIVEDHTAATREALVDDESDERVLEEIIEETLDDFLRGDERFHVVVDALFDEIEKRFDLLTEGEVRRNRQGWPVSWSWASENRAELLKAVSRFSSNYARFFGSLLTPLVSGIRVAGPFSPTWIGNQPTPRLVIVDGEGLGHTPSSAAALSTSVTKRIEEVDAVVLVDNAKQPMLAAPQAAMKAVVTTGNARKLIFCFTHFDLVTGPNLPTFSDREGHVRASGENVLKAIGDDLGPFAERVLRQRLENGCFFVGGIDKPLDPARKAGRRSIDQLSGLISAIDLIVERPEATEVRPVYDRLNLVLAVREAAMSFHALWRGRLGLDFNSAIPKAHWAQIKALSRRFAEGWADEYADLKPVAELEKQLKEQVYRMLSQPVRWEGPDPSDDEKQQIIDGFANAIAKEIGDLSSRRLNSERHRSWQEAYAQAGTGSTFVRARLISSEIYDRAAPVPSVTPSPDQNSFLHEVSAIVSVVAEDLGIALL